MAAAVASRGRGRAFLRTLRPVCPSLALTPHTDLSSVALGCHGHRRVASSTLAPSEPELRGFVRSFVRVCGAPFAKHCVGMSLAARLLWRASSRARSLLLVDRRARNRPKRSLTNPLYLLRCARSRSSRLLRLCVCTLPPLFLVVLVVVVVERPRFATLDPSSQSRLGRCSIERLEY